MSTGHQVLSFVTSVEIATSGEMTKDSEMATRFDMAFGDINGTKDTCCVVEFVIPVFPGNGFRMLFPDGCDP